MTRLEEIEDELDLILYKYRHNLMSYAEYEPKRRQLIAERAEILKKDGN